MSATRHTHRTPDVSDSAPDSDDLSLTSSSSESEIDNTSSDGVINPSHKKVLLGSKVNYDKVGARDFKRARSNKGRGRGKKWVMRSGKGAGRDYSDEDSSGDDRGKLKKGGSKNSSSGLKIALLIGGAVVLLALIGGLG
ncbi:hypothetical protein T439DRAFT_227220 [Meredithblackwellia eburnea MCA 4105]